MTDHDPKPTEPSADDILAEYTGDEPSARASAADVVLHKFAAGWPGHPTKHAMQAVLKEVIAPDIRTLIERLRAAEDERDRATRALEAIIEEREKEILALSDDQTIAAHVAQYNAAEEAVAATHKTALIIKDAIIASYRRERDALKLQLEAAEQLIDIARTTPPLSSPQAARLHDGIAKYKARFATTTRDEGNTRE